MSAESTSPWIAVADRLPPEWTVVLAAFEDHLGSLARAAYFDPHLGWIIGGGRAQLQPTHWMAIPDLPTEAA